jgi:hypothetical protein
MLRVARRSFHRVCYVSDIEGNLEYFMRWVGLARGVRFDDTGALALDDGCAFVFGGDLYDKGPGDIRLTTLLCDLKDRYPRRVWLLYGNRDLCKLRLSSELATPHELDRLHDSPPFWDARAQGLRSWLAARSLPHTQTTRLRWILECTMGAPDAFEFRRQELTALAGLSVGDAGVSDAEVTASFVDSVKPGGFVTRYLRRACFGVRLWDTVCKRARLYHHHRPGSGPSLLRTRLRLTPPPPAVRV